MHASHRTISWKVAGVAGEGIDITGIMFGKACMRHGMNVFTYREYPSLIRGGHSSHQVHASFGPQTCHQRLLDVMVAFNEEAVSLHLQELSANSVVICDATHDRYDVTKYAETGATFYDIPLTDMARKATGQALAQNVVSLGVSAWILGLDLAIVQSTITDQFAHKDQSVTSANLQALQDGYTYAKEHCVQVNDPLPTHPKQQLLVTGNHAVAFGALSAGVQYFSAYPMTPASEILHVLASQQGTFPLVVKHAEDEISAINQAIGASYAGVRAMTASATGGYALMVEATSLAAVAETPLVICVGQRPGPATGLPTWTCQSDLQMIIHAGHGEVPKVVFTPSTMAEHFELTRLAFALAEKYHLVVFILSDKFALESYATMPMLDETYHNQRVSFVADTALPTDDSYRRFAVTDTGYSPRSIPGQAHGLAITNSYEHDHFGYATEDATLAAEMNDKRQRKMLGVAKEVPGAELIGVGGAEVTLVSWGSTRLVTESVVHALGGKVNAIHLSCVWPFPTESFTALARTAKSLVMIEGNATGQLQQLIRQETGLAMTRWLRRYDGRPFYAEDIITYLTQEGMLHD